MFRFTIRDVLWLTCVVALVVCWYGDHTFQVRRRLREQEDMQVKVITYQEQANAMRYLLNRELSRAAPKHNDEQPGSAPP